MVHIKTNDIALCCKETCLHDWEDFATCLNIDEIFAEYLDDGTALGQHFPVLVCEPTNIHSTLVYCIIQIAENKSNWMDPTKWDKVVYKE